MENLRQFFIRLSGQLKAFWGKLSGLKKITLVSTLALLGVGLVALIATRDQDTFEYLFENLTPEDEQGIVAFMKRNNMGEFAVDQKGIKVPSKEAMSLRLKLSQEGLPQHGVVGWEKFDAQEFTRTELEQRINKQRAIQGELARTPS